MTTPTLTVPVLTSPSLSGDRPQARTDPASAVELRGWSRMARWAADGMGLLLVGLAVPLAILAIGMPLAFVLRLAAALIKSF